MSANKITWVDKVALNPRKERVNQWQDQDILELKTKFNANDDRIDALTSGYQGSLAIADTPTEDGYYFASESGTYTNAGSLVVSLGNTLTFINVSDTQTVFSKIEISIDTLNYETVRNISEFDTLVTAGTSGTWMILDDITLTADKTIPSNVTLYFNGGSIDGAYTITFDDTKVIAEDYQIFGTNTLFSGNLNNDICPVEWFGAVGDGVTVDSVAFQNCIDVAKSTIRVKRTDNYYLVGDVNLTSGKNLIGVGRKRIYEPTSVTDMEGTCAIVFNTADTYCIDFKGNNSISNINFYGVDKSCNGIPNDDGGLLRNALFFRDVSMCKFSQGFGSGLTVNNSRFWNCHASGNANGFYNLVDSHVYGAEINANSTSGVSQQTGANDTVFVGCKNEWNTSNNWLFFESESCQVIGGVTDRAGLNGFKVGSSKLIINGVRLRRNGSSLTANNTNHIFVEGATTELVVIGCTTATGYDDGGGGNLSPLYSVGLLGSAVGNITISGCEMSGAVTSPYSAFATPTVVNIRGNIGIEDLVNTGLLKISKGNTFLHQSTTSVGASTSSVISVDYETISTYKRSAIEVSIVIRDTSTGGSVTGKLIFTLKREGGAASAIYEYNLGDSNIGNTVSENAQVELENIATDASTFDIRLTNNSANNYSFLTTVKQY